MYTRLALAALTMLAISGEAWTQTATEQKFRKVEFGAQKFVRLGVFGRLKADCTPALLPKITVIKMPEMGSISVKEADVKLGGSHPCAGRKVRLVVVIYRPMKALVAKDFVQFSVVFSKKSVEHNVSIVPGAKHKDLSNGDDAIEL